MPSLWQVQTRSVQGNIIKDILLENLITSFGAKAEYSTHKPKIAGSNPASSTGERKWRENKCRMEWYFLNFLRKT